MEGGSIFAGKGSTINIIGGESKSRRSAIRSRTGKRRSEDVAPVDGGVDVSHNAARSGGAVSLNGASLTVEGPVSFVGNAATGGNGRGGAVSAVNSKVEVSGADFSGNSAKSGIRLKSCVYYYLLEFVGFALNMAAYERKYVDMHLFTRCILPPMAVHVFTRVYVCLRI